MPTYIKRKSICKLFFQWVYHWRHPPVLAKTLKRTHLWGAFWPVWVSFSFSKFLWFCCFQKRKYWKWFVWPLLVKISYLLSKWTDWNDLKYILIVGGEGFLNIDITAYSEYCWRWWLEGKPKLPHWPLQCEHELKSRNSFASNQLVCICNVPVLML